MAEERLIDDDLNKDKKYKIRVNEDGEEELYIDESEDGEDEETDIPVFEVQESDTDDEEAAVLTPEQLAERERLKAEEERAREEKSENFINQTVDKLSCGDFEGALFAANKAEEVGLRLGEVYSLKLRALTRDFSDYNNLEESAAVCDSVKAECTDEQKQGLLAIAAGYKKKVATLTHETEELKKKNDEGKEERRGYFASKKKRGFALFLATAIPFAVFLILAISFSTIMFSDENGLFLVLTIVFAALALATLIATVFTARTFWDAERNVKLNEKDTSTELGRQYLAKLNELNLVKQIYTTIGGDI
jgi:hypothetical protein